MRMEDCAYECKKHSVVSKTSSCTSTVRMLHIILFKIYTIVGIYRFFVIIMIQFQTINFLYVA